MLDTPHPNGRGPSLRVRSPIAVGAPSAICIGSLNCDSWLRCRNAAPENLSVARQRHSHHRSFHIFLAHCWNPLIRITHSSSVRPSATPSPCHLPRARSVRDRCARARAYTRDWQLTLPFRCNPKPDKTSPGVQSDHTVVDLRSRVSTGLLRPPVQYFHACFTHDETSILSCSCALHPLHSDPRTLP